MLEKVPYVKGDIELGPLIGGPMVPPNPPRKKKRVKKEKPKRAKK